MTHLGKGETLAFDTSCCIWHTSKSSRRGFGSNQGLSIMQMFGGFSKGFFEAYHAHNPKAAGFVERKRCYQLYHYLNHYNIFGPDYRESCLNLLK